MDREPEEGTQSPWGVIDTVHRCSPGVLFVGTPSHGGIWVAPHLRKNLPEGWRRAYFEEDCEWAIVELAMPGSTVDRGDEYAAGIAAHARQTVERFYPELVPVLVK